MSAEMSVLFCADPLAPTKVDPYFADQAAVVRALGGNVAVIDHDALAAGDIRTAVRRIPSEFGSWWYRGWMISSRDYAMLANTLAARGIEPRVTPDQYRAAHELPGWYDTFTEVTPATVWMPWTPGAVPTSPVIADLIAPLGGGAAIVKDFVKSRKHEWDDACFISDLTDIAHTTRVIARMVDLQDDTLNGGIVVRRFEHYRQAGRRTAEARVWWIDGAPALVGAHPDTPDDVPHPDLAAITPLVQRLGCRFVTTDVGLRDDGQWRVVEVGDGQVSDLPRSGDASAIFPALAAAS